MGTLLVSMTVGVETGTGVELPGPCSVEVGSSTCEEGADEPGVVSGAAVEDSASVGVSVGTVSAVVEGAAVEEMSVGTPGSVVEMTEEEAPPGGPSGHWAS